jgi:hypothetical protein
MKKLLSLAVVLGACSGTGLGDGVRKDITARMQTVQTPLASCYEEALTRDRKLQGQIEVSFKTKPSTGEFTNVKVTRDDLRDAKLSACVVEKVSALKLESPTKTSIDAAYPFDFVPLSSK